MKVNVNASISTAVKDITVSSLTFRLKSNELEISVPYTWLDNADKPVKSGLHTYTATQLIAAFVKQNVDLTPVITIFENLLAPAIECKILKFNIADNGTITGVFVDVEDNKYVARNLTEEQIGQAIAPITIIQLRSLISAFVSADAAE